MDTGHSDYAYAWGFYENFKRVHGGMKAYSKGSFNEKFFPDEKNEVGGGELLISGYNIENLNEM